MAVNRESIRRIPETWKFDNALLRPISQVSARINSDELRILLAAKDFMHMPE